MTKHLIIKGKRYRIVPITDLAHAKRNRERQKANQDQHYWDNLASTISHIPLVAPFPKSVPLGSLPNVNLHSIRASDDAFVPAPILPLTDPPGDVVE